MAAIRTRKVRMTTSVKAKRSEIAQAVAKRRMKRRMGPPKTSHDVKVYYEIVATDENEANNGLFRQAGDLYVFKPFENESFLWNRVRNMSDADNIEVWNTPVVGIRAAFRKLKVDYPHALNRDPAALLDWTVQGTGDLTIRPYEDIIRNKWFPFFVYRGSKFGAEGLFASKSAAYETGSLYGITVYKDVPASSWYRATLPDVQSDVLRSNQYDEDAYQHWKQTLLSTAEVRADAGYAPEMDWTAIQRVIRDIFGPRTQEVMQRLRGDLAPELHRLSHHATRHSREYTENRPRKRRRCLPSRR